MSKVPNKILHCEQF